MHRHPWTWIPSWKLPMHLQTWLLLPGHQVYQPVLQWHRDRGRVREIDDGKFFKQKEVLENYVIFCPSCIQSIRIVYKIQKAQFVDSTTILNYSHPKVSKGCFTLYFKSLYFRLSLKFWQILNNSSLGLFLKVWKYSQPSPEIPFLNYS